MGIIGTPPSAPPLPPAPSPPSKSYLWVYVAVAVVVVEIMAGSVVVYEFSPGQHWNPYNVTVTEFDWYSFYSGRSPTYLGNSAGCVTTGGHNCWAYYTYTECGSLCGSTTIQSVSVAAQIPWSPSVRLVSSNTPLTIQAGTSGTVVVVVGLPNAYFYDAVAITLYFAS